MRDNSFSKLKTVFLIANHISGMSPLRQERKAKANLESRQEAYLARLTKAHLNDEVGRFSLKYLPSGLHTSFAGWQVQKREDGDASAKERQAQVQVFQVYASLCWRLVYRTCVFVFFFGRWGGLGWGGLGWGGVG